MNTVRLIAVIQLAVAALFLITTLITAYNAWNRWSGISSIVAARARMVDAYDESVRRNGAQAAAALPKEPAAVLLDIDLTKDADYARLEDLERRCPAAKKEVVRVAEALSLVLRGKPAPEIAGADGVLLKVLAALMQDGKPSALVLPRDPPPHHAVLVSALRAQLRAAFTAGDRDRLREAAGALCLLTPTSADGPTLAMICGALDPNYDAKQLDNLANRIDTKTRREVLHELAAIVPERATLLEALSLGLPSATATDKILEATVRAVADGKDALALAHRCFDAGRIDLAKQLLPKLPAESQAAFRNLISNQEGDVAELGKSATPALIPRISSLRCRPGLIAFHLSNELGMVPKSAVKLRLNGVEITSDKITHTGTLYSAETSSSGPAMLEISAGSFAVFNGKVTL